eukprot:Colp12_sorted_trinity150504_noHs@10199
MMSTRQESFSMGMKAGVRTVIVPPLNFAMVQPQVYRSGYPTRKNFPFLKKLGLKSVLYLGTEPYMEANIEFCKANDIEVFWCGMKDNKEPFVTVEESLVTEALEKVLDVRNHPILIHCSKGKHKTGCLVGCLRKLLQWSITSIFEEHRRFVGTKVRILDLQFIELYDVVNAVKIEKRWAPYWIEVDELAAAKRREKLQLELEEYRKRVALVRVQSPQVDRRAMHS